MLGKISTLGLILLPVFAFSSDPANLPVPPTGFDSKSSSIPHGKVDVSLSYSTQKYGMHKVSIYTPPGYSTSQKYPVVYLMHGIGGNEVSWIGQGSNEGDAANIMDYLLSKNLCKPMIVVMPDGNIRSISDSFAAFAAFGDVLIGDLIPFVEKTYSAATDPDSRALSGLSMGGGQTYNFGFPHTDLFHYLGAYSAAPNSQAPATTITDVAKAKSLKFIFIGRGDGPTEIKQSSDDYHAYLDKNNIPHMYQLEAGLNHEKRTWDRCFYNFAQRIFTASATGIEIRPLAQGARAAVLFGRAPTGGSQILVARPDGKGVVTLDGRALPAAPEASLFQGIHLQ